MNNNRPITIYTWMNTKLNQIDPKVIIKDMDSRRLDPDKYDPEENAKQLARLFSISLPGNTLDVFYNAIAESIMIQVSNGNIDLFDREFVSGHTRAAINQLVYGDNKNE